MSCLFNSIGSLLELDPARLRQNVCDYLSSNPEIFDDGTKAKDVVKWLTKQSLESYVKEMRSTQTWGGAHEIRIMCDLLKCKINVYDTRSEPNKVITFNPQRLRAIKELDIRWNGCHFSPVKRKPILHQSTN